MLEISKHVFICAATTDFTTSPPNSANLAPLACDGFGALYVHLTAGASGGGGAVTPLTLVPLNSDAIVPATLEGLPTFSVPVVWRGTGDETFARIVAASSDNMGQATIADGTQMVTQPGEWSIPHTPAVGVRATISRAAGGAGVRHVCKAISASLAVAAADIGVAGVLVNLRDGATGAGTILWSKRLCVVAAGGLVDVQLSGLNIVGSPNTAMTLEFAAAPGAASFEDVTLGGITVTN